MGTREMPLWKGIPYLVLVTWLLAALQLEWDATPVLIYLPQGYTLEGQDFEVRSLAGLLLVALMTVRTNIVNMIQMAEDMAYLTHAPPSRQVIPLELADWLLFPFVLFPLRSFAIKVNIGDFHLLAHHSPSHCHCTF
jgi:hypothetical protein